MTTPPQRCALSDQGRIPTVFVLAGLGFLLSSAFPGGLSWWQGTAIGFLVGYVILVLRANGVLRAGDLDERCER